MYLFFHLLCYKYDSICPSLWWILFWLIITPIICGFWGGKTFALKLCYRIITIVLGLSFGTEARRNKGFLVVGGGLVYLFIYLKSKQNYETWTSCSSSLVLQQLDRRCPPPVLWSSLEGLRISLLACKMSAYVFASFSCWEMSPNMNS